MPMLLTSNLLAADEEERRNLACRLVLLLCRKVPTSTWSTTITSLVGALIRAASDKRTTSSQVFSALTDCVVCQTALVKPFYPQLQRIFVNALALDEVQEFTVQALIALMPARSRPESLANDLYSAATSGGSSRIPALKVLTANKVDIDPSRCLEVVRSCMSDGKKEVREVTATWITRLLEAGKVTDSRKELESLLILK